MWSVPLHVRRYQPTRTRSLTVLNQHYATGRARKFLRLYRDSGTYEVRMDHNKGTYYH